MPTDLTAEQRARCEDYAEACIKYKHRWIRYLESLYGATFIREFGMPARIMCTGAEQLYGQIVRYNRARCQDAYVSVNAYEATVPAPERTQRVMPDYTRIIPTRLYCDFDYETKRKKTDKTLADAHADALAFIGWLEGAFHAPAAIQLRFSGSKGFAVEVRQQFTHFQQIEALCKWAKEHYETLDVSTDHARIYRVPYSLHPRSLRQCIPVPLDWSTEKVLEESTRYRPPPVVI